MKNLKVILGVIAAAVAMVTGVVAYNMNTKKSKRIS